MFAIQICSKLRFKSWKLKPFAPPQLGPHLAPHFSAHPLNMTSKVARPQRNITPSPLMPFASATTNRARFILNTFQKIPKVNPSLGTLDLGRWKTHRRRLLQQISQQVP